MAKVNVLVVDDAPFIRDLVKKCLRNSFPGVTTEDAVNGRKAQALLQREGDKAALEVRIARLTRIILHSTRIAKPSQAFGLRYRHLLLRESQA